MNHILLPSLKTHDDTFESTVTGKKKRREKPKLKNIDVVLLTDSMAIISSTDTFESKSLSENNGYATTDTSTCSSFKISPSKAFSYYKSSDSSLNSESTSCSLDHNPTHTKETVETMEIVCTFLCRIDQDLSFQDDCQTEEEVTVGYSPRSSQSSLHSSIHRQRQRIQPLFGRDVVSCPDAVVLESSELTVLPAVRAHRLNRSTGCLQTRRPQTEYSDSCTTTTDTIDSLLSSGTCDLNTVCLPTLSQQWQRRHTGSMSKAASSLKLKPDDQDIRLPSLTSFSVASSQSSSRDDLESAPVRKPRPSNSARRSAAAGVCRSCALDGLRTRPSCPFTCTPSEFHIV